MPRRKCSREADRLPIEVESDIFLLPTPESLSWREQVPVPPPLIKELMHMEAARLKLGLGVDTVVSTSPLRRPSPSSLSSSAKLRLGISSSAAALLKPLDTWTRLRSSSAPASASSASSYTAPPPKEKEGDLVFVAGATGRVGSRAVRELIKLGFRVRAAVRDAERASSLVQVT
jgi:hypothetical protein